MIGVVLVEVLGGDPLVGGEVGPGLEHAVDLRGRGGEGEFQEFVKHKNFKEFDETVSNSDNTLELHLKLELCL